MPITTRMRILEGALELFNEQGTARVTTNHVAAALKMSPGNLYYHFSNKKEIVRALFEQIKTAWDANYAAPTDSLMDLAVMEAMIRGNFVIQERYLFFFRDLTLILNADAALAKDYTAYRERGFVNAKTLLAQFAHAGVLRPAEDADALDDLVHLLWLVGDFWLVYSRTGGAVIDQQRMQQGVRLFRRLLKPHLKGPST